MQLLMYSVSIHVYMYAYIYRSLSTLLGHGLPCMNMCVSYVCVQAPNVIKTRLQGDETFFDTQIALIQKLTVTLGHHTAGSVNARKRFEAMIA